MDQTGIRRGQALLPADNACGRVSAKRPEMGILTMRWELFDAKAEKKAEMTGINLIKVRSRA